MSTVKHTPGPWQAIEGGLNTRRFAIEPKDRTLTLAHVNHILGIRSGEAEANAKLIAAAPELLDALRGLLAEYEGKGNDLGSLAWNAAKYAIAKAEVQS